MNSETKMSGGLSKSCTEKVWIFLLHDEYDVLIVEVEIS